MDGPVGKLIDSVGSIFRGSDILPWCDRDIIAGFESEVVEAKNEEQKNESLMRLSWALVHSRQPEDVNRGIGMLEASLDRPSSPEQAREKLYLLAVGRYRTGDYTRSRQLLERCLEIQHDWRQAMTLQRLVEEKTRRGWYNISAFHFHCTKMIKWMPMNFSSPTIVSTIKLGKLMANSLSCATIMPT